MRCMSYYVLMTEIDTDLFYVPFTKLKSEIVNIKYIVRTGNMERCRYAFKFSGDLTEPPMKSGHDWVIIYCII